MPIAINSKSNPLRTPWNKGRLVGQKRPLRPKEVWAIRVRLQIKHNKRDLAMFNLAIDSKLRGCDLVSLRVDDVAVGGHVRDRATIIQRKTGRPVQFEITEQTRASLQDWLNARPADRGPYVFPSRVHNQPHVTARQYARVVHRWIEGAGMDSSAYGTHSMRRTKAAQIYRTLGLARHPSQTTAHPASGHPRMGYERAQTLGAIQPIDRLRSTRTCRLLGGRQAEGRR